MQFLDPLARAASSRPIQSHSLAQFLLSCLAGDRPCPLRRHGKSPRPLLFLTNLLLSGYSKLGRLATPATCSIECPTGTLSPGPRPSSLYPQHGVDDDTISLFAYFRKASDEGPNEFLLASTLRACTQSRAVSFGEQVHGIAVKLDLAANVYVGTALVNLYAKAGCMDAAMLVFDAQPAKNPVTWTAVITGYSQIGQLFGGAC